MAIRRATGADVDAITAVHVASWQTAYRGLFSDDYLDSLAPEQRRPMWARVLASDASPVTVWVAERDGVVVGFCSHGPLQGEEPRETADELHTLYLRPGAERQGIGTSLLQQAEDDMAARGQTEATLWVLRDNMTARRFYEARGWMLTATEKHGELWGTPRVEVQYRKRLNGRWP